MLAPAIEPIEDLPEMRRIRIARGLDDSSLKRLLASIGPESGTRLEFVMHGGRRERIPYGLNVEVLRALYLTPGSRLELVTP